jgi:hypothetical protein
VNDPFFTVPLATDLERRGRGVFIEKCMTCHNMPNVFSNRDHVDAQPLNRPPLYGHTFDVGVAERNALGLEVRRFDATSGTRVPVVLPLARQDGTTIMVTVTDDIGAAGVTKTCTASRCRSSAVYGISDLTSTTTRRPLWRMSSTTSMARITTVRWTGAGIPFILGHANAKLSWHFCAHCNEATVTRHRRPCDAGAFRSDANWEKALR